MILCQVGEYAQAEIHTVHPVQTEGMGGDLHDRIAAARVRHLAEQALELKALRGGALRLKHLISDHVLNRTDEADLGPGYLLQNGFEQVGHGGLPVGPGDADHRKLLGGMAKPVGPQLSQRRPCIRDQDIGRFSLRWTLAENCRSPLIQGGWDELVSVRGKARNSHEQASRSRLAGIVTDRGDFQLLRGGAFQHRNRLKQILEQHDPPSFPQSSALASVNLTVMVVPGSMSWLVTLTEWPALVVPRLWRYNPT